MVNDVLDLAKIESGRAVWRDQPVDVAHLIHRAANSMAGVFALSPELRLEVLAEPGLPRLSADPDRLIQVLQNLLSNAAKFTPRGAVEILAGQAACGLRITVRDQGVGVTPDELELIFSNFYQSVRGDILENKVQGTGLGLAICRGIMEHYGGRIWAESTPGAGSSFHLDFPATALS
jgi:signal transduction histidine kinase